MIYAVVRLSLTVLACLVVVPAAMTAVVLRRLHPPIGLPFSAWVVCRWSRLCCLAMGIHVRVSGEKPPRPALLAPNHISYLDIVTVGSLCESLFVSKADIRGWLGLGHLARLGGTVFLERERRRDTHRVAGATERVLGLRARMVVFLEGHAGPGDMVQRYRTSLLQAPVSLGVPCVPIALRYTLPQRPDLDTREAVAWHSHAPLGKHLWQLARSGRIEAEVRILPARIGTERKALAAALERDVRSAVEEMWGVTPGAAGEPAPDATSEDRSPAR